MSDDAQRICIVVLGMHRSGTSAVARIISLLGAALPAHVMSPGPANPAGYWEPDRLVAIHDRMLAEAGSRWDDWRGLDQEALPSSRLMAYRDEIIHCLRSEYGQAPLFVLKDPRLARIMPMYSDVWPMIAVEPCYVVCTRHPRAIWASLAARDDMNPAFAALLWLRYTLDAEAATRGHRRAFVSYEALVSDWRQAVAGLAESIAVAWPRTADQAGGEIDEFISRDLDHEPASIETIDLDRPMHWVRRVHGAMEMLVRGASEPAALGVLDAVRKEFDPASAVFGAATFPELNARAHQVEAGVAERNRLAAELNDVLNSLSWRMTKPLRSAKRQLSRAPESQPID